VGGTVEAIFIGGVAQGPMRSVAQVEGEAGVGLEGDRYAARAGSFSGNDSPGRALTLIEAEAVEAASRDYGMELDAGDTRRNVVTRGVALNHLVGKEFTVGSVRLLGIKLNEPCEHLEKVSGRHGIRKALTHRGGLRADILEGGTIRVGDQVTGPGG
jgi:MOSC domain-containing protein YiiM